MTRLLTPYDIAEVLGFVPLLEVYLRRCAQVEMPAQLQEIFRHHRLTARHGGVPAQLSAGQPISVTELARRMGVLLSTARELVAILVGPGWSSGARTPTTGAGQQRREPLHPPVDRDVVDLNSALRKQLFDVAVGETNA